MTALPMLVGAGEQQQVRDQRPEPLRLVLQRVIRDRPVSAVARAAK